LAADFITANDEYLSSADHADLSIGDRDWSMALWVCLDDAASAVIIGKDDGGGNREYRLHRDGASFVWLARNVANTATVQAGAAHAGQDVLQFVVCDHDATGNNIGVTVNAGARGQVAIAGVRDSNNAWLIGSPTGSAWDYFNGGIDEIGIWPGYLLTSDDRTYLYNGGAGRTYPPSGGGYMSWWFYANKWKDFLRDLKKGLVAPGELQRRYGQLLAI
jgi:hypothetical protein